jgi:signal peptidase II
MRVLWVSLAILVVDQLTKVWVVQTMFPGQSIPVLGDWFKLTYTTNPGIAFGLEVGPKLALSLFSVVATMAIVAYLWYVRSGPLGYRIALATIIGGAMGNVIDRTFYGLVMPGQDAPLFFGEVVDFIHFDIWRGMVDLPLVGSVYVPLFPIWNVADMAIVLGVATIIIFQSRFHAEMTQAAADDDEATADGVAADYTAATEANGTSASGERGVRPEAPARADEVASGANAADPQRPA